MRFSLIISLAIVSFVGAAPPSSQNAIISQFFGYVEAIRDIESNNMLTVTLNFVRQIVQYVPAEHRGPATAALQTFVDRGMELRQRGTTAEKSEHFRSVQNLFESMQELLNPETPEAQVIAMSMLGLLSVASEFAKEDEKFHNKFVQGATQMKAKLAPSTVARESQLFELITKYINSNDFQEHDDLMEQFLTFKERY